MTEGKTHKTEWPRWVGAMSTLLVAVLAFSVQWGVVTAKLDQLEKRLDEFLIEVRSLRTEYQGVERRVSYLEGRANGYKGER